MLSRDPEKRPRIGEVVDRLFQLRTSLGVQVLIAVDNVWQTSICYRKSDILYILRGLSGLLRLVNAIYVYLSPCLGMCPQSSTCLLDDSSFKSMH